MMDFEKARKKEIDYYAKAASLYGGEWPSRMQRELDDRLAIIGWQELGVPRSVARRFVLAGATTIDALNALPDEKCEGRGWGKVARAKIDELTGRSRWAHERERPPKIKPRVTQAEQKVIESLRAKGWRVEPP